MSHVRHLASLRRAPNSNSHRVAHHLIALADDVARAGLQVTAERLVEFAHDVFDQAYPVLG